MKIELKSIKIGDLIKGYSNDADTGVKGYGGKLDIRPPYQREFRYDGINNSKPLLIPS